MLENSQCAVVQASKQREHYKTEQKEVRKFLEHENFGLQVCVKVIND